MRLQRSAGFGSVNLLTLGWPMALGNVSVCNVLQYIDAYSS